MRSPSAPLVLPVVAVLAVPWPLIRPLALASPNLVVVTCLVVVACLAMPLAVFNIPLAPPLGSLVPREEKQS